MADAPEGLTSEQLAAGNAVAGAATTAAEAAPDAATARADATKAAQEAAAEHKVPLSREEAEMIATMVVDHIDARGGFEPPPEQLAAPSNGSPDAAGAATIAAGPERPEKTSFAERFRSR